MTPERLSAQRLAEVVRAARRRAFWCDFHRCSKHFHCALCIVESIACRQGRNPRLESAAEVLERMR